MILDVNIRLEHKIMAKADKSASCVRDNLVGRFQATKVVGKEWQVLKEKKVGLVEFVEL